MAIGRIGEDATHLAQRLGMRIVKSRIHLTLYDTAVAGVIDVMKNVQFAKDGEFSGAYGTGEKHKADINAEVPRYRPSLEPEYFAVGHDCARSEFGVPLLKNSAEDSVLFLFGGIGDCRHFVLHARRHIAKTGRGSNILAMKSCHFTALDINQLFCAIRSLKHDKTAWHPPSVSATSIPNTCF